MKTPVCYKFQDHSVSLRKDSGGKAGQDSQGSWIPDDSVMSVKASYGAAGLGGFPVSFWSCFLIFPYCALLPLFWNGSTYAIVCWKYVTRFLISCA